VDIEAGSRALPGCSKPLAPGTGEGGTGAESPAGGNLAGVQYQVSSARGLAAAQLADRLGTLPELCSSAEDAVAEEAAAALAGVAVAALVSDAQEALEEACEERLGRTRLFRSCSGYLQRSLHHLLLCYGLWRYLEHPLHSGLFVAG
jgi:hypothetical protein